jgi:hypothetical protein
MTGTIAELHSKIASFRSYERGNDKALHPLKFQTISVCKLAKAAGAAAAPLDADRHIMTFANDTECGSARRKTIAICAFIKAGHAVCHRSR